MTGDPKDLAVETAQGWFGVAPPNDAALEFAADLRQTVEAFEALRGRLRFEDEPVDFEAALLAYREAE
ncbi:hypothetical protein IBL26_02075 [Roseomonas aerophila]|uniref:Uncharacterized protein n=1 Tax=Teichococcus aerophilus TaxID=1224513 RepID=A0ABR7RGC2_9PROT|nr:hypothetical protein [Pseudoroseomonas aerophila]MBC9205609.1 hypothetical protein [Pseudoroseomonas aerophila]